MIKIFEIRDRMTFIPAIAFRLDETHDVEAARYLMARAGYGRSYGEQRNYVFLMSASGGHGYCSSDVYGHGDSRTMKIAHDYIIKNWANLKSGDVVDVEYILGEVKIAATPERFDV